MAKIPLARVLTAEAYVHEAQDRFVKVVMATGGEHVLDDEVPRALRAPLLGYHKQCKEQHVDL